MGKRAGQAAGCGLTFRVDVGLLRVLRVCVVRPSAAHLQLEYERGLVRLLLAGWNDHSSESLAIDKSLRGFHTTHTTRDAAHDGRTFLELELARIDLDGNETQAVGKHFVLDDGSVVVYPDVLDGHGGDLGEEDATEGVRHGGIDADEVEHEQALLGLVVDYLNLQVGHKVVDVELVVHAE